VRELSNRKWRKEEREKEGREWCWRLLWRYCLRGW
jgi:hypothetical protein